MFTRLKKAFDRIKNDRPGERFMNFHKRGRKKLEGHPVKTVLYYSFGILLIFAGLLLGFLPGAPGIILGIPGLALVAAHSKALARFLDAAELRLRTLWAKLKGRYS